MDAAARRALLDEYFDLEASRADAAARDRRAELRAQYEAGVDRPAISRCPFTDEVFTHSLDTGGLDGLWWQYEDPIRPITETLPRTYLALTGAVRLDDTEPEPAPFDRKPGPEVPFVVPRMLLHDDVVAVVSHVRIGELDAYPVVYFAQPVPPGLARFNDWGANLYSYESSDLADAWDSIDEEDSELDFDLARWIESGDLCWIAPGDTGLTLRDSAAGCPFVGLDGSREWTLIDGVEWPPTARPRRRARRR